MLLVWYFTRPLTPVFGHAQLITNRKSVFKHGNNYVAHSHDPMQSGHGEKCYEIQGGGQKMAVMVG